MQCRDTILIMESLPFYDECNLNEVFRGELQAQLNQLPFGQRPIIFHFAQDKSWTYLHQQKLEIIECHLRQIKINPCFPYPIYLVWEGGQGPPAKLVNIIEDRAKIPGHFNLLVRRRGRYESRALDQIGILAEKIRNAQLVGEQQSIAWAKEETKKLFMISREVQYYQDFLALMEQPHGR